MEFNMDRSVGFLLNRTATASKARFGSLIKDYGISAEQWTVLFRVVEKSGISQKELAESTYKDQGNLTRMIDKLVEKGYLSKIPDEQDRRAYKLFAAPKAKDMVRKIIPVSSRHNEKLTENFTEEERSQLNRLLNKLYENTQRR